MRIAALITIRNSPKVKITAGSVSSLSKEPRVTFNKPNNSATQRYVPGPPLTSIPGTSAVATQNEIASAAQRINNLIKRL